MEIIDELEPHRRGPYAGAVGYFDFNGNMDTCIALRTIVIQGDKAYVQAGAGIVADSVPANEWNETLNKARGLLKAIEIAEGWVGKGCERSGGACPARDSGLGMSGVAGGLARRWLRSEQQPAPRSELRETTSAKCKVRSAKCKSSYSTSPATPVRPSRPLCTAHFALCTAHFALCTAHFALCSEPLNPNVTPGFPCTSTPLTCSSSPCP